jgi:hypothetical protein
VRKVRDPAVLAIINEASMVYLLGGLTDKLQHCLFGDSTSGEQTPALEALQRKPWLAGSSAGPMCTPARKIFYTRNSGDSYNAIRDGKVESFGEHGFSIFRHGVLDAHVGERGRQGRDMVLKLQASVRYAFGIDENTAIVEDNDSGILTVVGEKGVAIFAGSSLEAATQHYLTEGDMFNTENGEVRFAGWKTPCDNSTQKPSESTNIFSHYRRISLEYARWVERSGHRGSYGRNPVVVVAFSKQTETKTVCGERNGQTYTSFSGMQVAFTKGNAKDLGFFGDVPVNREATYLDN